MTKWFVTEPNRQGVTRPVLHQEGCPALARTNPDNVFPLFAGEPKTVEWVLANGFGWDRACGTCCGKDFP